MSHVGKKLAKLNAKTVKFNSGAGGGEPEFISTDYAAALAFMPEGLERELLAFVWWPDGADVGKVQNIVDRMMRDEWRSRNDALTNAEIAVFGGSRDAKRLMGIAKAREWPSLIGEAGGEYVSNNRYHGVRSAALYELRKAGGCKVCGGRCGFTDAEGVEFECEACFATGREKSSDRWRAEASGIKWTSYRDQQWSAVYEWVIRELRTALATAEHVYSQKLGVDTAH